MLRARIQISRTERLFTKRVTALLKNNTDPNWPSDERIVEISNRLREIVKEDHVLTPDDQELSKRFELMPASNVYEDARQMSLLVARGTNKRVRFLSGIFEAIRTAHEICSHAGPNATYRAVQNHIFNVSQEQVDIYVDLCGRCRQKWADGDGKNLTYDPKSLRRCQVSLIDMRDDPEGWCKYLLVYRDRDTSTLRLRPLGSNKARAVAEELVNIWCDLGAPQIFHSHFGEDYDRQVLNTVSWLWPECKVLRGKSRFAISRDQLRSDDYDLKYVLQRWQGYRPGKVLWSHNARLLQFLKNNELRRHGDGSICSASAHRALYRRPLSLGLTTVRLPEQTRDHLTSEDQLKAHVDKMSQDASGQSGGHHESAAAPTKGDSCKSCWRPVTGNSRCGDCQRPCHSSSDCNFSPPPTDKHTNGPTTCVECHWSKTKSYGDQSSDDETEDQVMVVFDQKKGGAAGQLTADELKSLLGKIGVQPASRRSQIGGEAASVAESSGDTKKQDGGGGGGGGSVAADSEATASVVESNSDRYYRLVELKKDDPKYEAVSSLQMHRVVKASTEEKRKSRAAAADKKSESDEDSEDGGGQLDHVRLLLKWEEKFSPDLSPSSDASDSDDDADNMVVK